eukprot:gi/632991959/ref/XP_007884859.1/ PREDICTED: HAUS augmin-like complex subunit 4 [Callorhinchus milii]
MLNKQLKAELYTKQTVEVHDTIRARLQREVAEGERERAGAGRQLGLYAVLGSEFQAAVGEYTALRDLISNKEWALREFGKAQE